MIQTALIQHAHNDLVTDAAYDMYGLHLATCGLDQKIKLWALDESTGSWNPEAEWKAHDGAVTKITWAHAEFGRVIASGSFDRLVKVWDVDQQRQSQAQHQNGTSVNGGAPPSGPVVILREAKGSIRSLEFSPHHFGLKLATISSDNHLRIYECLEQAALSNWQLQDEVEVSTLPSHAPGPQESSVGQSAATSTPTPSSQAHTLAPSGSNTSTGGIDPSASLAASLLAAQQQQSQQTPNRPGSGVREADGGWALSWIKDRYWGELIAVSCGLSNVVRVIQFFPHRRPQVVLTLEPPSPPASSTPRLANQSLPGGRRGTAPSIPGGANNLAAVTKTESEIFSVTSVAWAPSCGRSFQLIATGSRDGRVRIWKVKPPPPPTANVAAIGGITAALEEETETSDERWTANLVAEFDDHKSSVGRVEWNITGTVLSSAGYDGRIRLWKQTIGGVWRPAGHISVEQATEETEKGADVDMDDNAGAD